MAKRKTFGLVFERHQPEAVELPQRQARRATRYGCLSLVGARQGDDGQWHVVRFERVDGDRVDLSIPA